MGPSALVPGGVLILEAGSDEQAERLKSVRTGELTRVVDSEGPAGDGQGGSFEEVSVLIQ
jgi:hypothetical protein